MCVPDCTGKACGDDGCGGTCGECIGDQMGCVEGACVCQPACEGKSCGPDGCNGTCGTCEGAQDECIEGVCVCQPACEGKNCGEDGCGDVCGTCAGSQDECIDGVCTCIPACDGLLCGDDGCGGVCGECAVGDVCYVGACCTPKCQGKECGDDGCGSVCGVCPGAQDVCQQGTCVCIPDCAGKLCGSDGCDGKCGDCLAGDVCFDGTCCTPDCTGQVCGDNQCGGFCGNGAQVTQGCPAFNDCVGDPLLCELYGKPDLCGTKECGADGIGGVCGLCPCLDCPASATKCEGFKCITPVALECWEIFDCFGTCPAGDKSCLSACVDQGDALAQEQYDAFVNCLTATGFYACPAGDKACQDKAIAPCMIQYYDCFHGDESCSNLYVCLIGCPGGDSNCTNDCFTNSTIEALNTWDFYISCLDSNGYYTCPDAACKNAALDACKGELTACTNGPLDCYEVFGCIQSCEWWDEVCRIGCRLHGTVAVQASIDEIGACVEQYCVPATAVCEAEVLVKECAAVYAECLAL